jgi:hypothetical protein
VVKKSLSAAVTDEKVKLFVEKFIGAVSESEYLAARITIGTDTFDMIYSYAVCFL